MEQTENQDSKFRIRLKSEDPLKAIHVVKGFVDDRKADDGIDDKGVRVNASQNTREQGDAVSDGEQANVDNDVLHPVEKEDDTYQECQVIITCNHVLRAQVDERDNC